MTAATTGAGEGAIAVPVEATLEDGTNARCEPLAVVPVPLGSGPALVRVLTGVVPSGADAEMTGIGWLEMLQSERPGRNEEP